MYNKLANKFFLKKILNNMLRLRMNYQNHKEVFNLFFIIIYINIVHVSSRASDLAFFFFPNMLPNSKFLIPKTINKRKYMQARTICRNF